MCSVCSGNGPAGFGALLTWSWSWGVVLYRLKSGGQRVGRGASSCLRTFRVNYEQAVFPLVACLVKVHAQN